MMNDLEATAHGVISLHLRSRLGDFFDRLAGPSLSSPGQLRSGHTLVMAMGTGLGVALIAQFGAEFRVVPLEGGHTLLSPAGPASPQRDREAHMLAYISHKLYRGQHSPEYEDICSGRGLEYVYEWLVHDQQAVALQKQLTAAEIVQRALGAERDPFCNDAVLVHYRFLMRAAMNWSIMTQCKNVILAGDNQVFNGAFVAAHAKELELEFHAAPKGDWMNEVTVLRQTVSFNINLEGALQAASNAARSL
eukprot:TRINITY_DN395_c0_g1_i16.p1 TRINITY_DN395_c0_g1~~TRINITY_DN395_c0_g1_i16.p1  ORF type:complete len:249 (-),score=46.71 TRINITY_DN395_c0_g1_i16:1008-1754(-)